VYVLLDITLFNLYCRKTNDYASAVIFFQIGCNFQLGPYFRTQIAQIWLWL